jgi:hypothetical protein
MTNHPIQADEDRPIRIDVRRARGGSQGHSRSLRASGQLRAHRNRILDYLFRLSSLLAVRFGDCPSCAVLKLPAEQIPNFRRGLARYSRGETWLSRSPRRSALCASGSRPRPCRMTGPFFAPRNRGDVTLNIPTPKM